MLTHVARNAEGGSLRTAYTPAHWPESFTQHMLGTVVAAFAKRSDVPAMRLHATDSDTWYDIDTAPEPVDIHGNRASLVAWIMGRSPGTDLATVDGADLPVPSFLY